MKSDKNTLKGFIFFLLRLISVALVVVSLYLAYDWYRSYKVDIATEALFEMLDNNGLHINR